MFIPFCVLGLDSCRFVGELCFKSLKYKSSLVMLHLNLVHLDNEFVLGIAQNLVTTSVMVLEAVNLNCIVFIVLYLCGEVCMFIYVL
jgi:hypothetical protein